MHDVLGVAVADGDDDLMHYFGSIPLLEVLALHDHFEQFATAQDFSHDVDFFVILVGLENLEHVRMVEAL